MAADPEWLKYAQLIVAALTPIMTGVVGIILVRMGTKLDVTKQLHQELLRKRLQLFEDIAPKINDVFCFFQAVGHWADLGPEEIIKRKRAIDRVIQVNRYLFRSDFWETTSASKARISRCMRPSAGRPDCGSMSRIFAGASARRSSRNGPISSRQKGATTKSSAHITKL
jgi:hypothetical protein